MSLPERLRDGYAAFRAGRATAERDRLAALAEGQSPSVMVIGCCDSRVPPELIFDAAPGELFVVRNVANLVPPHETGGGLHGTSAAIEFAVEGLKVRDIVVLGHARCGGIAAYATGAAPLSAGNFIGSWISLLTPLDRSQPVPALEQAAVGLSLSHLMGFPFVARAVREGRLALHGAWYSIFDATLWLRDPVTGAFSPLDQNR